MIYLLLGNDDFSKKEFIDSLRKEAELIDIAEPDKQLILQAANAQSLFEGKKLVRIIDLLGKLETAELIDQIKRSSNIIVFVEQGLDKRKTETKKLLANKNLTVKEFAIPKGSELTAWISERAKMLGLKIGEQAQNILMKKLGAQESSGFGGGFGAPAYDLWQVNSELQKLKAYAEDKEVSTADVESLVADNLEEDLFKITNAIADQQKQLAVKYLVDYIDLMAGTDEKSKIISLSGIIAEQFRGILLLKGMLEDGISEAQIMAKTRFSSGKVFIYKKLAQRFSASKLLEALKKLELLDAETKTSTNPAALQFFMIINSAM